MILILTLTHFSIALLGYLSGCTRTILKFMDTDYHMDFIRKVYGEKLEEWAKDELEKRKK